MSNPSLSVVPAVATSTVSVENSQAGPDMQIYPGYSERSFVVLGEGTRDFSEALKAAGGRFNGNLTDVRPDAAVGQKTPGWVFSNKALPDVEALFQDIAEGVVQPQPRPAYAGRGRGRPQAQTTSPRPRSRPGPGPQSAPLTSSPPLRTTVPPSQRAPVRLPTVQYQELRYNVVRPTVGMKANISMNGGVIATVVTMANPSPSGFVDIVYVKPNESENPEDLYKLAVTAGTWQVVGVVEDHSVAFSV